MNLIQRDLPLDKPYLIFDNSKQRLAGLFIEYYNYYSKTLLIKGWYFGDTKFDVKSLDDKKKVKVNIEFIERLDVAAEDGL